MMMISTIRSNRLLGDERTILNGEDHEILFVDDSVLDSYSLFALFRNARVDVMKHTIDEFVLAEDQGLYTHWGVNKL